MTIKIEMKTGRGLNDREHWAARARRVKAERDTVGWSLVGQKKPKIPAKITLRRMSPGSRMLDNDNLQGSLKAVRDAVASWLDIDDADERVTWEYAQRPGKKGQWLVEIEFDKG